MNKVSIQLFEDKSKGIAHRSNRLALNICLKTLFGSVVDDTKEKKNG